MKMDINEGATYLSTSIEEELDGDPDQATCQQAAGGRAERSSRARTGGRWPPAVEARICIRERGRETKQLSSPLTTLTSNSIDFDFSLDRGLKP